MCRGCPDNFAPGDLEYTDRDGATASSYLPKVCGAPYKHTNGEILCYCGEEPGHSGPHIKRYKDPQGRPAQDWSWFDKK